MRTAALGLLPVILLTAGARVTAADKAQPMLCHDVYFTLKADSPQAREALVAGCKKYLAPNPGIVWFAAGPLVEEHQREVNDRDFGVALHIVFQDKASHDKYQECESHKKFIEEFSAGWEKVRVFDSWLAATAHAEAATPEAPQKSAQGLRLPGPAAGFAGMIEAKVLARSDRGIVVAVLAVPRSWETSKAKDSRALVGKRLLVTARSDGRSSELVRQFLQGLKEGEDVALDVAHRQGDELVILELTEAQRRRVAE
ncbi:MAG: Dabb family protein [Thermoguttaceae bacterium]